MKQEYKQKKIAAVKKTENEAIHMQQIASVDVCVGVCVCSAEFK